MSSDDTNNNKDLAAPPTTAASIAANSYDEVLAKAKEKAEAVKNRLASGEKLDTNGAQSPSSSSENLKRKFTEDNNNNLPVELNTVEYSSPSTKRRPGLGSDEQPKNNIDQWVAESQKGYAPPSLTGEQITEEFYIPAKAVGLVIGKGGDTIKRIEIENGVTLTVEQVGDEQRKVVIIGLTPNVRTAKLFIDNLVRRVTGEDISQVPSQVNAGSAGSNYESERMAVPRTKVGFIIGRGGETIRDLQVRTGATITITPDSQADPNAPERELLITGNQEAREFAKQLINDLVNQETKQNPNAPKTNLVPLSENETTSQIMVPAEKVGLLIGRGGDTIRRIQAESGARVHFDPSTQGLPMRPLEVCGNPDQIAYLEQLVKDIIEEKRSAKSINATMSFNLTFDVTGTPNAKSLHIPADKVGLVIGKGGETIRYFERQTGAKIHLDQTSAVLGGVRTINVAGTVPQVAYAEQLISEKIGMMPRNSSGAYEYPAAGVPPAPFPGAHMPYHGYGMPMDPNAYAAYPGYMMPAPYDFSNMPPQQQPVMDPNQQDPQQQQQQQQQPPQQAYYYPTSGVFDPAQAQFPYPPVDPYAATYANPYPGYQYNYQTQQWEAVPSQDSQHQQQQPQESPASEGKK